MADLLDLDPTEIKNNKIAVLKAVVRTELAKEDRDILINSELISQDKKNTILAERQVIYLSYLAKKSELKSLTDMIDIFNFRTNIYEE
ncbi:MAG: hypothetical protein KC646_10290 [Candidatus Cloacimonetes bacterium]|nr:hypothetical protein [Candidatus Cloacimonadota bacterium]